MKETQLTRLREDWLAGNAVVTFIGALLIAWGSQSDVTYKLPFNVTIPALPEPVLISLVGIMFMSSLALAVASTVPPLHSWTLRHARGLLVPLSFLAWIAFLVSWAEGYSELPPDQWWSRILLWGGLVFVFFLTYRIARAIAMTFQSLND